MQLQVEIYLEVADLLDVLQQADESAQCRRAAADVASSSRASAAAEKVAAAAGEVVSATLPKPPMPVPVKPVIPVPPKNPPRRCR